MWYISLICKNTNIDMNQLKDYKTDEDNMQLSKREKIIQIAINMGQIAGQIVEEYLNLYTINKCNERLIEKIGKQYENIFQLANQLDMTIDEILDENLRKVNSRYNEKGEATR